MASTVDEKAPIANHQQHLKKLISRCHNFSSTKKLVDYLISYKDSQ